MPGAGAVRYRMKTPPLLGGGLALYPLCQKVSGSAFSVNLLVEKSDYEQQGVTACFTDTGDSGLPSHRHFCRGCGSPVVTEATNMPGMLLVKAGTLDNPGSFPGGRNLYRVCC